jgi:MFS family permease
MPALVGSQAAGGLGVTAALAVGALLVAEVFDREDLSGLVQSSQALGAALLALPAASLAVSYGRRAGLSMAYALGGAGALLAVIATEARILPLLFVGTTLIGGGTAAGLQARYAATDLAPPQRRGRSLSIVVWSTTIGAVVGPNLADPAGRLANSVGLEPLSGPFIVGAVVLGVASLIVMVLLRPDPLLTARAIAARAAVGSGTGDAPDDRPVLASPRRSGRRRGTLRAGWAAIRRSPQALLGMAAVAVAHTVMVAVMVMTPVHMSHGGAELSVIGLVLSIHVAGMFAFAPVMGWLVDAVGRIPMVIAGFSIQLVAVVLSGGSSEGHSPGLAAGMFLLGLGWSASVVAGSTLLTDSLAVADRPVAQGASDLIMGLSAAGGGALAGVVVNGPGYGVLNAGAATLLAIPAVMVMIPACRGGSNKRS